MRLLTSKYFLIFILVIGLLGLPVLQEEVQARGGGGRGGGGGGRGGGGGMAHVSGGGGYRGGGMGGGGFQGASRPGPVAGQLPAGGGSVQRPGPGAGQRPGPGGSYQGGTYQGGSYQKNVNVNVDNNWHRGRYGYGGVAGAVAVGATVAALSAAARPVVYGGTTYYVDGDTYYKPCYQGDEAAYCVVEKPNP